MLLLGLLGDEEAYLGESEVDALEISHRVYYLEARHVPRVVLARL